MPNNVVVSLSGINAAINKINELDNGARRHPYNISDKAAAPIPIDGSSRRMLIEAFHVSEKQVATGWNTQLLSGTYRLKTNFTSFPVVTANYDGKKAGVSVCFDVDYSKSSDSITWNINSPKGNWDKTKDKFYVHFIVIGT